MGVIVTKVQHLRHASHSTVTITGHGPTTNFELSLIAPTDPDLLADHLREEALKERAEANRHITRAARIEAAIAQVEAEIDHRKSTI